MSTTPKGTLRLVFLDEDGTKETITIGNAKTNLTANEIKTAMSAIRISDAIKSKNNRSLESNFSAALTTSETTDYVVL